MLAPSPSLHPHLQPSQPHSSGHWINRDVYVWRGKLVVTQGPEDNHALAMKWVQCVRRTRRQELFAFGCAHT